MSLTIMAAVSINGVIGDSNMKAMPWHVPEEMTFFKNNTMGKVIVMGRKTAQETGKLRGRDCIVLSRNPEYQLNGFKTLTLKQLLAMNEYDFDKEYVVCGGAEIYKELMPYASMMLISYMDLEATGDIMMPKFDQMTWKKAQTIEKNRFTAISYINTDRQQFAYNSKSSMTNKKSPRRGNNESNAVQA